MKQTKTPYKTGPHKVLNGQQLVRIRLSFARYPRNLLNLLEPNKSNIQNRSGSFCEKKANYVSLFAMDLEKLLVNDKIKALRQTNMSPKDYIKYLKKQNKNEL